MNKQETLVVDVMHGVKRDNLIQALRNQFMLHGLTYDHPADSSAAQIASLLWFAHSNGLLVIARQKGVIPQGQHGFYATYSNYFCSVGSFISLSDLVRLHNVSSSKAKKLVQTVSLQYHKASGKVRPQPNHNWVKFVDEDNEKRIITLAMGV